MSLSPAELLALGIASLTGSLHCAAMCGGFATAAAGGLDPTLRRGAALRQAGYAGGRALGYGALGALAGALGGRLALAGASLAGVQDLAGLVAGAVLLIGGLLALVGRPLRGPALPGQGAGDGLVTLRVPERRPAGPLRGAVARLRGALVRAWARGDAVGTGLLGLASALLPCGWLWVFVAVAAGTGSAVAGVAVMLVFWAGTLPALLGVAWFAGGLGRKLAPQAPRLVAIVMIGLGAWSLAGHLGGPRPVEALGGELCEVGDPR